MSIIGKFGLIGIPEEQHDLFDNNTDFIVIGSMLSDREITMEWTFELPISGRTMTGIFRVIQNDIAVSLSNKYSFFAGDEIIGVTFGAAVVGNEIRLTIVTSGIGEDPKMRYRKQPLAIAS